MSSFDPLIEEWSNNENILFFENLDDLGMPYSCEEWGNMYIENIPVIVDDGNNNPLPINFFPSKHTIFRL